MQQIPANRVSFVLADIENIRKILGNIRKCNLYGEQSSFKNLEIRFQFNFFYHYGIQFLLRFWPPLTPVEFFNQMSGG
jgi:hypothetical protein